MAKTKHRSFRPDNHMIFDEEEQKQRNKQHRHEKHVVNVEQIDLDELDEDLYAEVEYFLKRG